MSKHKNIKGWALRKSNIPHQPYHIIDDFGEMVCTVFQSKRDYENALDIQNIPRYRELVDLIVREYKDSSNLNPLDDHKITRLALKIDNSKLKINTDEKNN
tara:strand:- start:386 stop:688 length:303 start_codon:yes stop_codon:yes gene_type:complete